MANFQNSDLIKKEASSSTRDAKKLFRRLGTCSHTLFHILNREFGHIDEARERASDSLAGGVMQKGYQCGMLWGASLAAGAEAHRRFDDRDLAMRVAIRATQNLMRSFEAREETVNCREITRCDFSSRLSFAKYFFSGRFLHCFDLAEQWAPEAIEAALESLSAGQEHAGEPSRSNHVTINCASEVARRLGASEEEQVMVAGFAGGLGLSGNACGALAAAIWMRSLAWCREQDAKTSFKNPNAEGALKDFEDVAGDCMLCSEISGQEFETIEDHSTFIRDGGCSTLIEKLGGK